MDADEETVVPLINAFNLLEPFKAVLFANSPFGARAETLCGRDSLWSKSLHGLNPHNCGMYGVTVRSLADVRGYLESTSIYCVERGERYINFAPVPLRDYLQLGSVVGEYWDATAKIHRKCLISPLPSDVAWLRPFKFEDLTQRVIAYQAEKVYSPERRYARMEACHV